MAVDSETLQCALSDLFRQIKEGRQRIDELEGKVERYEAALRKITLLNTFNHDLPAAQKIARDALEGE